MNMLTNTEHSTVIKSFEIERLEFGKFCVSPNGPAIMDNGNYVEYSILGKSENFPPELVSSCKRIALKIEENSGGNDSDHFSYGTILRPFLHGGGSPRTVFFKVRQRYEEGETAVRGRQYRLGRFLTARDLEISPFMFFRAMKTLPLEGITLAESNSINSLPVLQNETDNTQISEFFVKKAVAFILSGVPIAISEDISEEDFFKCVSEVRAALPPGLRPFLSAGWRVNQTLANDLAISCSSGRSNTRAYFSAKSFEWSDPKLTFSFNNVETSIKDFTPRQINPGESYVKRRFSEKNNEYSTLDEDGEKLFDKFNQLPDVEFSEFPTWQEPSMLKTFRSPGLKSLDADTLDAFINWLTKGGQPPFLDAKKFLFFQNRKDAFLEIMEAFENPDPLIAGRAESALWESLADCSESLLEEVENHNGNRRFRARLLSALQSGKNLHFLKCLSDATHGNQAANLPDQAQKKLQQLLDKSLIESEAETLSEHRNLLKSEKSIPETYLTWVRENVYLLAIRLFPMFKSLSDVVDQFRVVSGNHFPRMIHNLQSCSEINENDRNAIAASGQKDWVAQTLLDKWKDSTAVEREPLISWMKFLQSPASNDPLWNIVVLPDSPFDTGMLNVLADDIENDRVPPSLENAAAVMVLQNWCNLSRRIRHNKAAWQKVINKFSPGYEKIFFPGDGLPNIPNRNVTKEVKEAEQKLVLTTDETDELIKLWSSYPNSFRKIAPQLWDMMIEKVQLGSMDSFTGYCLELQRGSLPQKKVLSIEDIGLLSLFINQSGNIEKLTVFADNLWHQVTSGWQIVLLLSVFRRVDFEPFPHYLEALITYRQWLKTHLSQKSINHENRRQNFEVASLEFQSCRYNPKKWKTEFSKTALWAAFANVPLELQNKSLQSVSALYCFVNGEKSPSEISDRAQMYITYLESYNRSDPQTLDRVVGKVTRQGLLPLLHKQLSSKKAVKELSEKAEDKIFGRIGLFNHFGGVVSQIFNPESLNFKDLPPNLEYLLDFVLRHNRKAFKRNLDDFLYDTEEKG